MTPPDQACLSASPSWIEHPGSAWNRSDSLPERGRPTKASSLPRRGDGRRLRWKTTRTDIKIQIPRGSHRRRSRSACLSDHVQTGVYSRPNLQPFNITPAAPESLLHPVIPCSYILGEAQKPGNRRAPESYTPVLQQQENPAKKLCPASLLTACLLACAGCLSSAASSLSPRRSDSTAFASRQDWTAQRTTHPIDLDAWPSCLLFPATLHCALFPRRQILTNALPSSRAWLYRKSLHVCSGQPTSRPPDPLKTPAATAVPPSPFPRPSDACAAWPPSRSPPLSQARRPPGRTFIEKKASPQKQASILCLPDQQPRLVVARRPI